jgi:hypothetical protein
MNRANTGLAGWQIVRVTSHTDSHLDCASSAALPKKSMPT